MNLRAVPLLLVLGASVLSSACGNLISVTHVGLVGVTVDPAGQPVIAVVTCQQATPTITLAEGRGPDDPDSKENVIRGEWTARTSFDGVRMLSIAAPDQTWSTGRSPGTLQPDRLFIVNGGTEEDEDASLGGVDFRVPDLAQLTPDLVRVEGEVQALTAFTAYRCPDQP